MMLFGMSLGNEAAALAIAPAVALFVYLNRDLIRKKSSLHLLALRSAAFASLLMVLAAPYVVREEGIMRETTSVLIIDDGSDSMSLLDGADANALAASIKSGLGEIAEVRVINMSEKGRTALGDALYRGITGSALKNVAVVLLTDGLSNYGSEPLDVAAYAARAGAMIYALAPEERDTEVYVKGIEGAAKTPMGAGYSGIAVVGKVGPQASYGIRITIDGKTVFEDDVVQGLDLQEFPFEHIFENGGPHEITTSIEPADDVFPQNNVFNKAVQAVEKPKVLLVGRGSASSPLGQVLDEFYDVDAQSSMPPNLRGYAAVFIDDMAAREVTGVDALRGFVNDGGGLVVVGGNNSYNNGGYYESSLEGLLPVKSREAPTPSDQQINIILLIDISGSTGNAIGGETKIDVEKAIASRIIRDTASTSRLGVIAFNSEAFIVAPLKEQKDVPALVEKVASLRFGGGTYIATGLDRAWEELKTTQGAKYVVLVSDGVTEYPSEALRKAAAMATDGITVHAVGVGFDTDRQFMSGIAERNGGAYFPPTEAGRVKITLGALEIEEEPTGLYFSITDPYHFITEGVSLGNVTIASFDRVAAKANARVLASTPDMKPLLAVWHFGLGRVAALAVDNGLAWAGRLYAGENSKIISSIASWATGDPERNSEVRIDCADTRAGDETKISVVSRDAASAGVGGEAVRLERIDDRTYYFSYTPEHAGFAVARAGGYSCAIAANYPEEYGEFGPDLKLLDSMAKSTGGRAYPAGEKAALVSEVSGFTATNSAGVSIEKTGMQVWFALLALCLFFADVAVRRIMEILRWGEKEKAAEKRAAEKPRETKAGRARR